MVTQFEHAASAAEDATPAAQHASRDRCDTAGNAAWGQHSVDIRLSIPLLFARYYLTIVAGKERRSPERRASERHKHPLLHFGNVLIFLAIGTVLGLAGLTMIQLVTRAWLLD